MRPWTHDGPASSRAGCDGGQRHEHDFTLCEVDGAEVELCAVCGFYQPWAPVAAVAAPEAVDAAPVAAVAAPEAVDA